MSEITRVVLGPVANFPEGTGVPVQAGNLRLAIFRSGSQVFAIEDRCPHRNFPLHDGTFDGSSVRCRTHGSCFNVTSGDVERGPASRGIRVYRAAIVGEVVELELPQAAG